MVLVDGAENHEEKKCRQAEAAAELIERLPDGFMEDAVEGVIPEELDCESGSSEKGPEDP